MSSTPLQELEPSRAAELSAFIDAELDDQNTERFARTLSESARGSLGVRYASYARIGDVMRSAELAQDLGREAAFFARMQTALESELPIVAPQAQANAVSTSPAAGAALGGPVQQSRGGRGAWLFTGGAASMAAAAALAYFTVVPPLPSADAQLAQGGAARAVALSAESAPREISRGDLARTEPKLERVRSADGVFIRDTRLDPYLNAHHRMGSAAAPAAFVRTHDLPASVCVGC